MYQSGLLLLTSPVRSLIETIGNNLAIASKTIRNRLYVSLEPGKQNLWPPFQRSSYDLGALARMLPIIYMKASSMCRNLDVRILLYPHKLSESQPKSLPNIDVVLTDTADTDLSVLKYVRQEFCSPCGNVLRLDVFYLKRDSTEDQNGPDFKMYDSVVLGGTFDRLHNGHKVLLSCSVLRAKKRVIVGVTDGDMIKKKTLWELIEPVEKRIGIVREFLEDIDPSLEYSIVPIHDPFGPSTADPDIDCIVVSEETKKGGDMVNTVRETKNFRKLDMVVINLVEEPFQEVGDEAKVSSSNLRRALLGSYLKTPQVDRNSGSLLKIALIGGLQSGRSVITGEMKGLGCAVINCCDLVHSLLTSNSVISSSVLAEFKEAATNSYVDKRKFELAVLKDKSRRENVSAALLSHIKPDVDKEIMELEERGVPFAILEMPSFVDNSWLSDVDEVWGVIVPDSEYNQHLRMNSGLSDEEIEEVTKCKLSNSHIVNKSHLVFYHQENDEEFVKKQVKKAWEQLTALAKKN